MKTLLIVVAILLNSSVQAEGLFGQFLGKYKVTQRWCDLGDRTCENLVSIEVGYDAKSALPFVVEIYKEVSSQRTSLWEGKNEDGEAYITGTMGLDANWTHQFGGVHGSLHMDSVHLYRTKKFAPLYYKYSSSLTGNDGAKYWKFDRKFKIVKEG